MSLRLRLIITSLVLIALTGVLGVIIQYEEDQVETVVASEQLNINKIVSSFLNLDVITDQLSAHYNSSTVVQWQTNAQQITNELAAGQFDEPNEHAASTATKQNLDTMLKAMAELAQSELNNSPQNVKLTNAAFATLRSQTQAGLANSLKLQQVVGNNLVAQQKNTKNIIIALCIALAFFIITGFVYLYMSITLPIKSLTLVIEDISRGKLDASISDSILKKHDEIGMLARAFDRTIVSLKLAMREEGKTDEATHETSKDT